MKYLSPKVLIYLDAKERSHIVADEGIKFARKLNAQVSILHIINAPYAGTDVRARLSLEKKKNKARKFITNILCKHACAAFVHVEHGEPADKIVEKVASLGIDVIVLGNNSSMRLPHKNLLREVTCRSRCSVLTV